MNPPSAPSLMLIDPDGNPVLIDQHIACPPNSKDKTAGNVEQGEMLIPRRNTLPRLRVLEVHTRSRASLGEVFDKSASVRSNMKTSEDGVEYAILL
jgi:hypothetical protein